VNLPPTITDLIADEGTERVVSIVSLWEIAIKHSLGRLALNEIKLAKIPSKTVR
jgi:PIN domain nuclease of toxin-antitoxin system